MKLSILCDWDDDEAKMAPLFIEHVASDMKGWSYHLLDEETHRVWTKALKDCVSKHGLRYFYWEYEKKGNYIAWWVVKGCDNGSVQFENDIDQVFSDKHVFPDPSDIDTEE